MRFNLCIDCRDNRPWNNRSSLCQGCFDKRMNEKLKGEMDDRGFEGKDLVRTQ